MTPEDDTAVIDDAAADDDFTSGFSDKPTERAAEKATEKAKQPAEKPEPQAAPEEATAPAEEAPEYVQMTAKDFAELRAAAAKTASYDQQLSRVFGTLGNLQKVVAEFRAQTPAGRKVEIPKDAFAAMERDFPELAQHTRSALEAALAGLPGTGAADVDDTKIQGMLAEYTSKREIEALEDAHPDWETIVGAVGKGEQPDPNHPFRKWLATKDVGYQTRINQTESAAVIGRAIQRFQTETKAAAAAAAPKPAAEKPREAARADRISRAVQPRGDGAAAGPAKNDDDEFEAGFRSARG